MAQLKHCPYCVQHNEEFQQLRKKYGHDLYKIGVFSSSPAFKYDGRWYHLQLCKPQSNSKGGYNWQECSEADHQEYIAIIDDVYTLDDAVEFAREWMSHAAVEATIGANTTTLDSVI